MAEAIGHLYDHPYLQTHAIGRLLVPEPVGDSRGRAVQRVLTDAIGELRPSPGSSAHAWRTYRYLFLRYVQALPPREVARELGISERQARRTYREAIDALASLLSDRAVRAASTDVFDDEVRALHTAGLGLATDLTEVVAGLRSIVDPMAAAHRCALVVTIAEPLPRLRADRAVVRQILLSLCMLALERGASELSLQARADDGSIEVVLSLIGAATAEGDSRLAVARRLIEAEGGAIVIQNGGAMISFRLSAARRPTVLVVDDNSDVVAVFRRYLESSDFDVLSTDSGAEGVRLAHEQPPAAIILDVMMVGQDGWETLQQLKNQPSTSAVPVIICSVLREGELARFLGAAELLPKPVTRLDLLAALGRVGLATGAIAHRSTP